ncbi:MAG TPA: hypothetical protein VKX17_07180 [Planctomycetota bacterium]|nr:hypothetical protein [Planctomycetota bacterium]
MSVTWKRANGLVWEEVGTEMLIVQPHSGARWLLNAAASAIWKICDGNGTGTPFHNEIARFCEKLADAGLLQAAPRGRLVAIPCAMTVQRSNAPAFRALGLTSGPRRRPSPRGNSGPG